MGIILIFPLVFICFRVVLIFVVSERRLPSTRIYPDLTLFSQAQEAKSRLEGTPNPFHASERTGISTLRNAIPDAGKSFLFEVSAMKSIVVLLSALALSLVSPFPAFAQKGEAPQLTDRETRFLFRDFKEINSFGIIAVSLVGDAEKIGMSESELNGYLKSVFKGYFPGVKFEDISRDSRRFLTLVSSRDKKVGNITFRVWVVGDDYPVAYHIKCDAGNFENPAIWTDEILGHGSRKTAPEAIKEIMNEMLKTLSVNFYKVRAQAM